MQRNLGTSGKIRLIIHIIITTEAVCKSEGTGHKSRSMRNTFFSSSCFLSLQPSIPFIVLFVVYNMSYFYRAFIFCCDVIEIAMSILIECLQLKTFSSFQ